MNTAAGLVTASPLQIALQMPSDPAAPVAAAGDFTAALAAACVAEPEAGMPEGMQSAAALAWLAGFVSTVLPAQAPGQPQLPVQLAPGTEVLTDSSDTLLADCQPGAEVVAAAALSFLQGMLAPAVDNVSRGPGVEPDADSVAGSVASPGAAPIVATSADPVAERGVLPAVAGVLDVERAAAIAAAPAVNSSSIAIDRAPDLDETAAESVVVRGSAAESAVAAAAVHRAAPVVVPNALMRAMNADAQPEVPGTVPGDTSAAAMIAIDSAASKDATEASSVGERLIGALADRTSMRTEGVGTHAEADRNVFSGPNLYASTRETVATAAGAVSSRPEVVHATVGSPRWANELGSRLAMMSVRGQHEGSLSLTPEHLGPLEVRISVNQDTTNVWFGAQHADTRAALAEALPRLREMFAASGLALGHAGVSHEMPGQEARHGEASAFRVEAGAESAETSPVAVARISSALLDTWA